MAVRTHRELIPRSVIALHSPQPDPAMLEQMSKNITRQGITNSTLNYLRVSGDVYMNSYMPLDSIRILPTFTLGIPIFLLVAFLL